MIGLRRRTVRVAPYDPSWAQLGRQACATIRKACVDLPIEVEHVGSTAVAGLSAKPIVDIVVGLPDVASVAALKSRLTHIGYIYHGEGEGGIGHLFVWESEPDIRTIHVHAVRHGSPYWKEYVCLRDILRQDADIRRRYEELKRKNATRFPNDRNGYTAAKNDFVREVLRERAGLAWEDEDVE